MLSQKGNFQLSFRQSRFNLTGLLVYSSKIFGQNGLPSKGKVHVLKAKTKRKLCSSGNIKYQKFFIHVEIKYRIKLPSLHYTNLSYESFSSEAN